MFGTTVAISNDFALVGARATGEKGVNSGSAYVYELPVRVSSVRANDLPLKSRFEGDLSHITVEFTRLPSAGHLSTQSYALISAGTDQIISTDFTTDCTASLSNDDTRVSIDQVTQDIDQQSVLIEFNTAAEVDELIFVSNGLNSLMHTLLLVISAFIMRRETIVNG